MRKKKYNRNKWIMHQTKKVLDTWCVCFMAGDDNCFVWNLDTGRQLEAMDPELADVIILNRLEWRIDLFALCVGEDGKPYIKCEELIPFKVDEKGDPITDSAGNRIRESLRHGELLPFLNDALSDLCANANKRHLIRPAWMAYAGSRDLNIEKEMPRLLAIFEARGGFERREQEPEVASS